MRTKANFRTALFASTMLATLNVTASGADEPNQGPATTTPIKHVIVIFQENVSFDHYFATYPQAANLPAEPGFNARSDTPTVNGLTAGLLTNNPNLRQPNRLSRADAVTCDQDHNYTDEQKAVDGGLLDKFVQAVGRTGVGCAPDGSTVMGYYDGNTVTALWNYAQHYSLNDNSFGTTFGPSTPGALNLISGQTHGAVLQAGHTSSGIVAGTDIGDLDAFHDDCGADKGGTVSTATTLAMSGHNLGDLLNAQHVTWGWFQGGFRPTQAATFNGDGSLKTPAVCGATHTAHLSVPNPSLGNPGNTDVHTPVADYSSHHAPFMYYASTSNPHHLPPWSTANIGRTDQANHNYDLSDFFAALDAGSLPAVSFLKAPEYQDGHPGYSDPLSEQNFLATVVNTVQQSRVWRDTAIIINYDDSDGWYDHVTGAVVNPSASTADALAGPGNCGTPAGGAYEARCGYGPRMPLLVISPWAKTNFVDHTTTDQSSILRFIEDNWSVGRIDDLDHPGGTPAGQGSFDQIAGTLLNMFDFDHPGTGDLVLLDPGTGVVVREDAAR
jgi:phospholipase C